MKKFKSKLCLYGRECPYGSKVRSSPGAVQCYRHTRRRCARPPLPVPRNRVPCQYRRSVFLRTARRSCSRTSPTGRRPATRPRRCAQKTLGPAARRCLRHECDICGLPRPSLPPRARRPQNRKLKSQLCYHWCVRPPPRSRVQAALAHLHPSCPRAYLCPRCRRNSGGAFCPHGQRCVFAHGEAELQTPPPGSVGADAGAGAGGGNFRGRHGGHGAAHHGGHGGGGGGGVYGGAGMGGFAQPYKVPYNAARRGVPLPAADEAAAVRRGRAT
jgi:hypothetical protein